MNEFEEVRRYKELLDKEIITQEEFEKVKADLLGLSESAATTSNKKPEKQVPVTDHKTGSEAVSSASTDSSEKKAQKHIEEENKIAEEMDERRAAEEKKLAEEVAARRAAEEKKLAEAVAARKRAEEESKFAEEMAKKRAEEEAKLAEEIEQKRKEEEAKIAEEMTQKRAKAEEKLLSEMPKKGDEVPSTTTGTQNSSSNQTRDTSSSNEMDDDNNIKVTDEVKKEVNELENNEKLSKSMPEEGGGQKKKSKAPVIIIGVVVLVALVVGVIVINNNKKVQQEATNTDIINEDNVAAEEGTTSASSDEPENKGPAKTAEVGETVKAETKYGDFEVAAISAARTNWYDNFNKDNKDSECIVVRFEINNIDYVGEYDEGYLNGYTLSGSGHLTVLDEDGFKTAFFDIAGPTDGQWAVAKETNVGEKARVSYTYLVPKGTKKVTVNVNGQYEIPVELDEEVVKQ